MNKNKSINVSASIEDKFTEKIGYSDKKICCNVKLFSQLISLLIITDCLLFFIQTFFRWGAPCFLWWNSISTTITFMFGHGIRLMGVPVGIYAITSIRKNDARGTRQLFYYLLFASFISALDIFLSLSEVHNVCHSNEINMWNDCSHEWGKQEYKCITLMNEECISGLLYDNMEYDKKKCENNNCRYIKNTNWIKPPCCDDSMWNYHNPCDEVPEIRNKIFDTNWCENFSDLYDVGIQIITTTILIGFAYIVNSYTIIMNKDLVFTPNPFDSIGED